MQSLLAVSWVKQSGELLGFDLWRAKRLAPVQGLMNSFLVLVNRIAVLRRSQQYGGALGSDDGAGGADARMIRSACALPGIFIFALRCLSFCQA